MGCGAETGSRCAQDEHLLGQRDAGGGPDRAREPLDVAAALAAAPASTGLQTRSLPVPHIQQAYNW